MNLLKHVVAASITITGYSTVPPLDRPAHVGEGDTEDPSTTDSGDSKAGPIDGRINVHIVPHTHDDVGWLKTVEEYYQGSANEVQIAAVKPILDTVIQSLSANPERKFIYVEMAFFMRWWEDQTDSKKEEVKTLVKEGRLQFANGGWASNDEATPTFVDIIDQHTLGTTSIVNLFGSEYVPKVGWQMDPFGHSSFQPTAYSKMGMDSWFFGRVDIEEFAFRKHKHTLETIHSNILTGITQMYQAPAGFHWGYADPSQNPEISETNYKERIDAFVALSMQKKDMYNFPDESTSHIMFTFGDDFEYNNADRWFRNIDKLITYLNKDKRVNAFYSTPEMYTESRFKQRSGESPASSHGWVSESPNSDWFPYCDGDARFDDRSGKIVVNQSHALWTGYFTSRPILKKLVRYSSSVLELCRIAEVFAIPPNGERTATTALWKALSVVQHHDGVSGTAKQRVVIDYTKQLEHGITACKDLIRDSGLIERHVANKELHYYTSMLSRTHRGKITSSKHSTLSSYTRPDGSLEVEFAFYRSATGRGRDRPDQASGTYIFRPDCAEGSVAACVPEKISEESPQFPVSFKVTGNRIDWSVGPLPDSASDGSGYEVVLILRDPSIRNRGKFFTGSNGYGWVDRQINKRNGGYDYVVTDPVSANYYPVVGGIGISDGDRSLLVIPDRSVGGTSLRDGEIEIMVHRRLFKDDAKGMNEPLNETDTNGAGIVVKGVTYFEVRSGDLTNYFPNLDLIRPPVNLKTITEQKSNQLAWSFLKQELPDSILVIHFHRLDVGEFCVLNATSDCWLVRVMHSNTTPNDHSGIDIDWAEHLNTVQIFESKELTLNAGKLLSNVSKRKWTKDTSDRDVTSTLTNDHKATVRPGDIRTYVFRVQPRQSSDSGIRPHGGITHETA